MSVPRSDSIEPESTRRATAADAADSTSAPKSDPFTEMTPRFGLWASAFGRRYFREFAFEGDDAERLRELGERGAIVYVMRYSSRLDYFLFNWLFVHAGVRLSRFANGIRFYYYRPFGEAIRLLFAGAWKRLRLGFNGMRERGFHLTREVVREGNSVFLFLRTDKVRQQVSSRRQAVRSARRETDFLRGMVDELFADSDLPVSLVPLALFWRKGARSSRFLNVFYGAPQRPSDTGKILSFFWNYKSLAVRVGEPIDLTRFARERREQGAEAVTKQVRRSLLIFLRREEKPVVGAALRTIDRIEEAILQDPEVTAAMTQIDEKRGTLAMRADTRARRYLSEIAAKPSPTILAILARMLPWILNRLFSRCEVNGLEKVVEAAKNSPLVMVPNHRSHFDYAILSWLFYEKHLVPPVVAAGINLSFFPLGPIFRRCGAFFLRRSFEGNRLYAAVFRAYVQSLIKDGATQEFFIEGTRSRTGKTLQPRLGMLSMVLDAFARGVRRDVQIVPVGFTYERLVEERSMAEERRGAAKTAENFVSLLRSGRVLRRNFGAVTVRFGEPLSLADLVDLERYNDPGSRRRIAQELGEEISRRINKLVTAGRTSLAATALLASQQRAVRIEKFSEHVSEVAALVEIFGLSMSGNLQRNLAERRPEAVVDPLLASGLVERRKGKSGPILRFAEDERETLAYYRATIEPALAWPAVLALALRLEADPQTVLAHASTWLDLLRHEYFPPPIEERELLFGRLLEHFEDRAWIERVGERYRVTALGESALEFIVAQLRPVLETYRAMVAAVRDAQLPASREELIKTAQRELEEEILLGEVQYSESNCPVTLGNAFLLLEADMVLEVEGNPRIGDAQASAGEQWARIDDLLDRLAEALSTG